MRISRAGLSLAPIVALVLLGLGAAWWRGPQPELAPPTAAEQADAARLLGATRTFLEAAPSGDAGADLGLGGTWFVTSYPRSGAEPVTVRAEGPLGGWAEPLRRAWPGWLELDHAFADPPSPRAGPWGYGLDVGLDGWIEDGGRVHLPVQFLLEGLDPPRLARFLSDHPGKPLRTHAWVAGPNGPLPMLRHSVDPGPLDAELLRARIGLAAGYLTRHLGADRRFDYEWNARTGDHNEDYNLLRHAGATYSLFQAFRVTGQEAHYRAGARALGWLAGVRASDSGDPSRCFEVEAGMVKLGGAALTLLALVEQASVRPADADFGWMRCLGEHILAQIEPDGDMACFYADGGRYDASGERSAYYPGEAIYALLRLYELDPDPRWLAEARRAADFLVHRRYVALGTRIAIPLDAWLVQGLELLYRRVPDSAYLDYAFAIGRTIARDQVSSSLGAPDLAGAPTLGDWPDSVMAGARSEALGAAARLERRFRPGERFFFERLSGMCRFALRNQLTDSILFGLRRPMAALGGFRGSASTELVRIDGVQHNLSALVGLLGLVEQTP